MDRQVFGLDIARCPEFTERSGGKRRKKQNALPQTFLIFEYDPVARCAWGYGKVVVESYYRMAAEKQCLGVEQQRLQWTSCDHLWLLLYRDAKAFPSGRQRMGTGVVSRYKSVEKLKPGLELEKILIELGCECTRGLRLPSIVASRVFDNVLPCIVVPEYYIKDMGLLITGGECSFPAGDGSMTDALVPNQLDNSFRFVGAGEQLHDNFVDDLLETFY